MTAAQLKYFYGFTHKTLSLAFKIRNTNSLALVCSRWWLMQRLLSGQSAGHIVPKWVSSITTSKTQRTCEKKGWRECRTWGWSAGKCLLLDPTTWHSRAHCPANGWAHVWRRGPGSHASLRSYRQLEKSFILQCWLSHFQNSLVHVNNPSPVLLQATPTKLAYTHVHMHSHTDTHESRKGIHWEEGAWRKERGYGSLIGDIGSEETLCLNLWKNKI